MSFRVFMAGVALFVATQATVPAAQISLFDTAANWRFLKGTNEASSPNLAAWRARGFDDSSWTTSASPFWYSTAATEAPFYSGGPIPGTQLGDMQGRYGGIFLRKEFTLASPGDVTSLLLSSACDDGFIAWINGVEVLRYNMPAGEPTIGSVSLAALGEPVPLVNTIITNTSMLVAGANVIAVQAFNASLAGSSDFGVMAGLAYTIDDVAPTVVLVNPLPGGVVSELQQIELLFSEPVSGVQAADLLVNGAGAASVQNTAPGRYVFNFPQPPTGGVSVAWAPGHGIADLAATPNPFAGGSWTYTLNTNVQVSSLVISEFLTANTIGIQDDLGGRSDWIELFNSGAVALNLGGWFLTDDPADLTKWRFPSVTIGAFSNLIVYASGRDRIDPLRPLHTNFKLSSDGGYLALVSSRTNIISEFLAYPQQMPDVSYGLDQLTPGRIGYFLTPTPGALNGAVTTNIGGIVTDVAPNPAVPTTNQNLLITAQVAPALNTLSNVTLRYRVMFGPEISLPMFDDGAHGDGAAGDGRFAATIPVYPSNRWQMVRWYIRATDVKSNVTRMPLFTSAANQPEYYGTVVDAYAVTSNLPVMHWFASNPSAADTAGGTKCSIFYNGQFLDNVSFNLHGQSSSGFPKKSYDIDLNPGNKLTWDENEPSVDDINLLTVYADKSHMRYTLGFDTYRDAGVPAHFAFPVRLHQNGLFYSVAMFVENGDDNFLKRAGLDPNGALYKMYSVADSATAGVEKKTRRFEGNTDLQELINGCNLTGPPRAAFVMDNIDVPEMVNFLAAKILTGDTDCCHKNYYLYRDSVGTREWQAFPWDVDLSFGRVWSSGPTYFDDTVYTNTALYIGGGNVVMRTIFEIPQLKEMYLRRIRTLAAEIFNPIGTPEAVGRYEQKIERQKALLGNDSAADFAKWATWGTTMTMTQAANQIKTNFLPGRRAFLQNTIVAPRGDLPTAQPPGSVVRITGFDYNPLSRNQDQEWISLTNPNPYAVDISGWELNGGISFRFKGGTVLPSNSVAYVSPNVVAFRARTTGPRGGQGFLVLGAYQGRLSAWGETLVLTDLTGRPVSTNSYTGSPSPAQQYLRITEIMYHPSAGGAYPADEFEYIELRNTGPAALDLRGVRLVNGVDFDFTTSAVTNLPAGGRVLVVRNPAAFNSRYGAGLPVAGQFTGSLENSGETLRLDDAFGEKVLEFAYNNSWYPITDGAGFSLVIVNESAPYTTWGDKVSWRASGVADGSPGITDPPPVSVSPVLVNEALTHSVSPAVDAIELHNPGASPVNVGGWFLSDDFNLPRKFRLPPTTIAAGGYAVFTEADFNAGGDGFALNSDGDQIWLFSGDSTTNLTGYYHGFDFGAAEAGVSFGRYVNSQGEEYFVAQSAPTLGAPNAGPRVGPVVVSEVMYHPVDLGTNDNSVEEFIEMQNITGAPVALFDPAAPTNTWRLRNAIDFDFPPSVTLAAGARLLVVGFDPVADTNALAQFRTAYFVPPGVALFGPWSGKLDNSGDTVELKKPDVTATTGVPYVLVEEIRYRDTNPWATNADGQGSSLQRWVNASFANDATNWFASGTTPGGVNFFNHPPEITLASPVPGGVYQQPTNVLISASATDLDGTITLVEYFANGLKLGESTTPPFQFNWVGAGFGTHLITVRARDNGNLKTVAGPVQISVRSQPPAITLTSPASGAIFPAGTSVTLAATASDADGTVTGVEFFVDGASAGVRGTAPYSLSWTAGPMGHHSITAVATDNSGTTTTSAVARVFVSGVINSNIQLVASNSFWRYLETTNDPAASWKELSFDDSGWKVGRAQLGYGDNDEATRVTNAIIIGTVTNRIITHYFRQTFVIDSFYGVTNARLRVMRDDGAVAYVNGVEVFRSLLPPGPVSYRTLATTNVTGLDESAMHPANIPLNLLQVGVNVVAVEVHQFRTNDTDMSFAADLTLNQSIAGPAITSQPQSRTNAPGTTATFSVTATGSDPLAYQWRLGNSILPGQTGPTLTLDNVQPAQSGPYTVVITNLAGIAVSEVAVLVVSNPDTDGDGLPDAWETANGTDPNVADSHLDPDLDGATNGQEYLAGTDPQNPASVLRLSLQPAGDAYQLRFTAVANRAYSLEYRPLLTTGSWLSLSNIAPAPADRPIVITDPAGPDGTNRFYQIRLLP